MIAISLCIVDIGAEVVSVSVAAPTTNNAANTELVAFLSSVLGVRKIALSLAKACLLIKVLLHASHLGFLTRLLF